MSYRTGTSFDSFGMGLTPTPMVKRLLIINTVVFFVGLALPTGFMTQWFGFHPREVIFSPWGVVTYMFVHGDLTHLFFNMLMLFFFGPPLEAKWGEQEFLKFYIISGLGGAALSFAFMPNSIIGASGALYGVMLAFAMNWPNAPIYIFGIFPVMAKYLVGFMAIASLLSATGSAGSGIAHFAHLGGLITAFLYLKADWRASAAIGDLKKKARKKRRLAIVPGDDTDDKESVARSRRPREDTALYDKVDAVLDKISAEGMSSLTDDELKLLDEVSKK
ncbi:MAG: rhomboid family intramembrane serine protease, partial [Gemmatimonadetes bacterium]|nr:rhomboid family intramembrane serine protease [Gemmatimonadota bacterium]